MPPVVRGLIAGAVACNAGLIAWTWYDTKRRAESLARFLTGPVGAGASVKLPEKLAVEKLVVLSRNEWPKSGISVSACRDALAPAMVEAGAPDADLPAALAALGALEAASATPGTVSRLAVLVAASLSARCDVDPDDPLAAERLRAGLLFRSLEGGRGVPTTRALLEETLASLPLGEAYPRAVVRAASGKEGGMSGGRPSDEISLAQFEAEPTTVLLLRGGLLCQAMGRAVLERPSPEHWVADEDVTRARGLVLAIRAVAAAAAAQAATDAKA